VKKEKLLLEVEVMIDHVASKHFPPISGRALFLREVDDVIDFVNAHRIGPDLNAAIFNELKSKFDALVERTQKEEKEDTGP